MLRIPFASVEKIRSSDARTFRMFCRIYETAKGRVWAEDKRHVWCNCETERCLAQRSEFYDGSSGLRSCHVAVDFICFLRLLALDMRIARKPARRDTSNCVVNLIFPHCCRLACFISAAVQSRRADEQAHARSM